MDTPTPQEAKADLDYITDKIVKRSRAIQEYGNQAWMNGFLTGVGVTSVITFVLVSSLHCCAKMRTIRV
jgi:hypothetical protein